MNKSNKDRHVTCQRLRSLSLPHTPSARVAPYPLSVPHTPYGTIPFLSTAHRVARYRSAVPDTFSTSAVVARYSVSIPDIPYGARSTMPFLSTTRYRSAVPDTA
eukprot:107698-Rhodomonas_salina.1